MSISSWYKQLPQKSRCWVDCKEVSFSDRILRVEGIHFWNTLVYHFLTRKKFHENASFLSQFGLIEGSLVQSRTIAISNQQRLCTSHIRPTNLEIWCDKAKKSTRERIEEGNILIFHTLLLMIHKFWEGKHK